MPCSMGLGIREAGDADVTHNRLSDRTGQAPAASTSMSGAVAEAVAEARPAA